MNHLFKLVPLFLLLSTVSVEAGLWYDSDTKDDYQWNQRIPIILNETIGVERVNEPILLKITGLNFSALALVDPQGIPDGDNEVGGNDIPYQLNGEDLLFRGNVSKNAARLYYLYISDHPWATAKNYQGTDLYLSQTRGGIMVENEKAIWEITSKGYYMGVNRYENDDYGSGITMSPGLDYAFEVGSAGRGTSFTAYAENWNCSILEEGPLRARVKCSTNSSTYGVEKVYSFFSGNAFFEVEENLEGMDKWEKDVRLKIHNRLKPYFNHTESYKFQMHVEGLGENGTFYVAARDTENGTGKYVFWLMGAGDFRDISFIDRKSYDAITYSLYLMNGNATGRVRYLFGEGGILNSRLEYERFTTSLATVKPAESNELHMGSIRSYDRVYDASKFVEVLAKSNQFYGTRRVICRTGDTKFLLYDDGTHGDEYGLDGIWANNESLQIRESTPTGEYTVQCNATDNKNNVVSDSERFLLSDRGRYHLIEFKANSLRIRPGGAGKLIINVTNPGHFDEIGVSVDVKNLPANWIISLPEEFDLRRGEKKQLSLDLKIPETQELGNLPLLIGFKSRDTAEIISEGIIDIDLYELEIGTAIKEGCIDIELRDEHGNPLDNADVTVTRNGDGELFQTDEEGHIYPELSGEGDISIEAVKAGYTPLSIRIGFRGKEVNYWFPVVAFLIIALALLIFWNYMRIPGRNDVDNAVAVALVIGIIITLVWVGLTMRGKEPFTALYFAKDSYSNYLEGDDTGFRYVVDCWEHEPTRYELDVILGDSLVERDEFWLCNGDGTRITKLEREKTIDVPGDLSLPARVRLILRANNKTYDIHYFLRGRVIANVTERRITCRDAVLNSDETDIDCGGSCPPCSYGRRCDGNLDCLSGFCSKRSCKEPTCYDVTKNQDEAGIDCGGRCMACHCFNGIVDLDETDMDCGGSCVPCETEKNCSMDSDCSTGFCLEGSCDVPTCRDGIQNQGEESADCGGPCKPCPSCLDGIRNQEELDTDCGGSCPECDLLYENETHVSWARNVEGFVSSVAISPMGEYIAAGSNSYRGSIHIFGNGSELIGEARAGDFITDVRFTEDGRFISPHPMSKDYLFNVKGINRAIEFPDNAAFMASVCNIPRGSEIFLGLNRTEARWGYWIPWNIHRIEFTPDCVYRVDGYGDVYGISNVQLFENDSLKWRYSVDGDVYSVAVSDNASHVAVGAGGRRIDEENYVYLFDKKRKLLWKYKTDWNIYGLDISDDGGYIIAGSRSGRVYLFNGSGYLLWEYDAGSGVIDVEIASDGSYAVLGTAAGDIYMARNPLSNCSDGIQNQGETDIDCGGPCLPCDSGRRCLIDSDCLSGFCHMGICTVPTCNDGIKNQGEKATDCGGPCLPCRPICSKDIDCGQDVTGAPYCYGDYVLRNYTAYTCINPGIAESYCETLSETMVEEHCLENFECIEGACVEI